MKKEGKRTEFCVICDDLEKNEATVSSTATPISTDLLSPTGDLDSKGAEQRVILGHEGEKVINANSVAAGSHQSPPYNQWKDFREQRENIIKKIIQGIVDQLSGASYDPACFSDRLEMVNLHMEMVDGCVETFHMHGDAMIKAQMKNLYGLVLEWIKHELTCPSSYQKAQSEGVAAAARKQLSVVHGRIQCLCRLLKKLESY
jgi:hypothetical protein